MRHFKLCSLTTDPVELWTAEESMSRVHSKEYSSMFGSTYRACQVIFRPIILSPILHYAIMTKSTPFKNMFHLILYQNDPSLSGETRQGKRWQRVPAVMSRIIAIIMKSFLQLVVKQRSKSTFGVGNQIVDGVFHPDVLKQVYDMMVDVQSLEG